MGFECFDTACNRFLPGPSCGDVDSNLRTQGATGQRSRVQSRPYEGLLPQCLLCLPCVPHVLHGYVCVYVCVHVNFCVCLCICC